MQPKELFPVMDKDGLGAFLVSFEASHLQWSNFSVLGESNSRCFLGRCSCLQVKDGKAETDAFAQSNPSPLCVSPCADLQPADSHRWELIVWVSFQSLVWWYHTAAAAKSLQSCPTLCDPIDGSPPGSPIPGILQARTLEWVAISFSNEWKGKLKVKSLSRVWLLVTSWTAAYQAPLPMGFSRQGYWSGMPLPSPDITLVASNWPQWEYLYHISQQTPHIRAFPPSPDLAYQHHTGWESP